MDTATAKQLLQSTDIEKLRESAESFVHYNSDSSAQEEQILKLQVLLWSRILQLQKLENKSSTEHAETLTAMGTVWMRMGENDRATGQLQKALELQPVGMAAARIYQLLGEVQVNASQYQQAAEYHQKAIAELIESDTASQVDLCLAYGQLAGVFEAQSEFSTALEWLEKAQTVCEKIENEKEKQEVLGIVLSQRGTLQEKLGQYQEAVGSLTIAHGALVQTRGKDHPQTKEIEYLLGMASDLAADS
jgi:tetratricopeptide (TPR) repeat protein